MKIAAYCRVSTDKDEQLDSLAHQKEFFSDYAEKSGHTLVRLYADEGISGTSLKKRTEFMRLMNDARLGIFDMVVVKDISRFARNTVDFLQSIRTLKALGINTLFLTANMESLGESEFILTVFSALAQEESVNLSKRVKFGKKINAQKGRVPQRVFGYDRIDNFTLKINPEEAKIVKEIYQLYNEEKHGCAGISMELNRRGYKTKFGCEWNPRGVRRVLTNPIYCGHYINHKFEIGDCLEGKLVHVPSEEHFHHERPEWAIVPKETFDKAQAIMDSHRILYDSGEPYRGARYSDRHIFSTLIKCEHCGRSFCRKHYTRVNTRVYWKCTTNDLYTAQRCDNTVTLTESVLLDYVRNYFSSLIENKEEFVNGILTDMRKKHYENSTFDVSAIDKKRKQLIAKKDRYQEMYATDIISMTELKAKTEDINKELTELDYCLKRHQRVLALEYDETKIVQQYAEEVERFLRLETVTNHDMRKIIDHITVNRDGEVKIYIKKIGE